MRLMEHHSLKTLEKKQKLRYHDPFYNMRGPLLMRNTGSSLDVVAAFATAFFRG